MRSRTLISLIAMVTGAPLTATVDAADLEPAAPPPLDTILDGYERVTPMDGGDASMYTLYLKEDTNDLLAMLPADYAKQRILLTNTLAGGFFVVGVQSRSELLYWKRYGERLALMAPQLEVRTTGDVESRRSRETLFPESVRLHVPIVALGPKNEPVIDLDELFIDRSVEFHKFIPGALDTRLGVFSCIKAFPENLSLSVQMPWPSEYWLGGPLMTLTFSMSVLPSDPDYKPREADARVGYFHTAFDDLARVNDMSGRRRYIKRWKLEKADPSLTLSPPREPIVFYIEHKTPIRYRRWVREGVLEWNNAFEAVGIVNAIEVYQQDARTGAHMEKDSEDVQYNFIVWNSNDVSFAIGPCRVDPRTGQILDADVVFNDGWIREGVDSFRTYLADIAMADATRETLDWLASRPRWDPRVRLADASQRSNVLSALRRAPESKRAAATGLAVTSAFDYHHGSAAVDGSRCNYGAGRRMDVALARLSLLDLHGVAADGAIDDVPEEFVGPLVKDVIMHEVGHVLGLRHNFKGSTAFSLDEIDSQQWRDEGRPLSGSVMDYNAINYHAFEGGAPGSCFMSTFGPYDAWAIRYGYADDDELEAILGESTQPEHAYLTDEDLYGPDPTARYRDLGGNALDFVDQQMALVERLRGEIAQRALEDGKTYQRARDAYMTLLWKHASNLATAARYVGGVYVRRDRVGNAERNPTEVVPAEKQRRALGQVVRWAFTDEAFGLKPELLDKMSYDKWMDTDLVPQDLPDPQLDVHDLILGVQASTMTALFNPTRLRRIYDNEQRLRSTEDAFTLAELFGTVQDAVWSELDQSVNGTWSARAPFVSSLRRNLQREQLERMIDLALSGEIAGAAQKSVASLTALHLRRLGKEIRGVLDRGGERLDVYSLAHLEDVEQRIEQALNAIHVYR